MRPESIALKNFKSFKNAALEDIPRMCVLVGANGTGKSTLFSGFGFLKDALNENIHVALTRLGGSRGFQEARTRNSSGPIEIELKFRESDDKPLITYSLEIDESDGAPFVEREVLKYRRGSKGKPRHFLDFRRGVGEAVTNEPDEVESELVRELHQVEGRTSREMRGRR
jgi:predicted ATPase